MAFPIAYVTVKCLKWSRSAGNLLSPRFVPLIRPAPPPRNILGMGHRCTPLSYMCYHAEFGRSTSKAVDVTRGTPKIGARWGSAHWKWSVLDPLQTRPSPRELPCRIWLLLVKRYDRIYRRGSVRKTGLLAYRLSKSLKVIGIDTDRSGSNDFLSVF